MADINYVSFVVALIEDAEQGITQYKVYPIVNMTSQVLYIQNDDNDELGVRFYDEDFMICKNVPIEIVTDIISAIIWKCTLGNKGILETPKL